MLVNFFYSYLIPIAQIFVAKLSSQPFKKCFFDYWFSSLWFTPVISTLIRRASIHARKIERSTQTQGSKPVDPTNQRNFDKMQMVTITASLHHIIWDEKDDRSNQFSGRICYCNMYWNYNV